MKTPHILTFMTCFVGLIVTFTAYFTYKDFEDKKHVQKIISDNHKQLAKIERHIQNNVLVLSILKSFFDASTQVSREDFKVFAGSLLKINPAIQAVEWVPKLRHKDRDAHKKMAQEDGFEHYDIMEPSPNGDLMVSGKRDVYYPVYYVEPYEGNEIVLGLDPPNHKHRTNAIKQATETGQPSATPAMTLTQEKKHQKGILIFSPVYKGSEPPTTIEERHENLHGLVLLVLRIGDMMNYTLQPSYNKRGVSVTDITSPDAHELLFESDLNTSSLTYTTTQHIDVAGRTWLISTYPLLMNGHGFFDGISWLVLLVGISFNCFLTLIIYQLVNRRRIVENLVATRTQEVQELSTAMERTVEGVSIINDQGQYAYINEAYAKTCGYTATELLDQEWHTTIADTDITTMQGAYDHMFETGKASVEPNAVKKNGERFNARITLIRKDDENGNFVGNYCFMTDITQRKTTEINLKQANAELEEFAYRTSHDLRSPLISSISLLALAKSSMEKNNHKVALDCINHIDKSLKKLDRLVGDILALTKIKAFDEQGDDINIEDMIDDALSKLSNMPNFERLNITKKMEFTAPLTVKESRLQLIVENLISNAIKYQDLNETQSTIEITTREEDGHFILEVKDNGLGIPEEHHGQLFKMFQRFHARTSYGSGLGLYMMKKGADILSGDLTFKALEKGSLFTLNIPLSKGGKDNGD